MQFGDNVLFIQEMFAMKTGSTPTRLEIDDKDGVIKIDKICSSCDLMTIDPATLILKGQYAIVGIRENIHPKVKTMTITRVKTRST